MKTTTVLGAAAIAAAIAASWAVALWSRASAGERIDALQADLTDVRAGVPALRSDARELAGRVQGLEAELARVRDDAAALAARVGDQGRGLAEGAERAARLDAELRTAREELQRVAAELRAELAERAGESAGEADRLAELAAALDRLGAAPVPAGVPPGTIVPWLPAGEGVPDGWRVCDGTGGTPDLRGLFLRGAGLAAAGYRHPAAAMRPAGVHAHATDASRSRYNLSRATEKEPGDWRILFDAGVTGDGADALAAHGQHVHADEHVPEHLTVVFLMKVGA